MKLILGLYSYYDHLNKEIHKNIKKLDILFS